jgi:hypothetical protein
VLLGSAATCLPIRWVKSYEASRKPLKKWHIMECKESLQSLERQVTCLSFHEIAGFVRLCMARQREELAWAF